jgi:glucarate dehydratase
MAHLAAATPNHTYDCATHDPLLASDLIVGSKLCIADGSLAAAQEPGLRVELDPEALARMHQDDLDCVQRKRDDAEEMRKHQPGWSSRHPRV